MDAHPCRSLRREDIHLPTPSKPSRRQKSFRFRHASEHEAWLSTEWRPVCGKKKVFRLATGIASGTSSDSGFACGLAEGVTSPPGRDAEPLRRSSRNYPCLERSAAPSQWRFAIQNRIRFEDPMPVLQHSCAAQRLHAQNCCAAPLCGPHNWRRHSLQVSEFNLKSSAGGSSNIHSSYPAVQHFM